MPKTGGINHSAQPEGDYYWNSNTNSYGFEPKLFIIGDSGAYGWNDGSAERFWSETMPITSSFSTFLNGINNGSKLQAAWGAALLAIDVFSFGEGSSGIKLLSEGMIPNAGGKVISFTTKETETYYRVFSKNPAGSFLTKVRPASRAIAREGLALPSEVNTAKYIQEVIVPAGTRLQRSRALSAFGKRGGLEQFQILNYESNVIFGAGVKF